METTILDTAPRIRRKLRWSLLNFRAPDLAIHDFTMTERISSLFSLRARLSIHRDHIDQVDPREIIGQVATLEADFPFSRPCGVDDLNLEIDRRFFTGIVTQFAEVEQDEKRTYFSVEVSPWLWLLSQTADCRVFQNMSAIEIVTQIFDEFRERFNSVFYRFRDANSQYERPKRDCCVQYNETALNFASRLLEEEGIYFYFEHRYHEHSLILAANHSTLESCMGQRLAKFHASKPRAGDRLECWNDRLTLTPGRYTLGDYHPQMSAVSLVRTSPSTTRFGNPQLEVYEDSRDIAKPFNEPDQRLDQVVTTGDRLARTRMEEVESGQRVIEGTSDCLGFTTGCKFERETPEGLRDATPYLLTEVHHTASQSVEIATGAPAGLSEYRNRFECVPANSPYRPPRVTARPVIHSVQTARVEGIGTDASGEQGEEIVVDKFGRVRVRFHWDRRGAQDGRTSAWIRVGQGWASNGFGMHFWPRVGDEVIVAFLNGDPDCPIVVGSVYNDRNMPPYKLPEGKTKSGIKTRSTPGGEAHQFNEIRFEDRKGSEQLYMHAERSLDTVVEASESHHVGGSRTTTIGHNDKLTVQKGDRAVEILQGHDTLKIQMGNRDVGITQGDDMLFVESGNADVVVPAGRYRLEANVIELTAVAALTLKCGPSQIVILPGLITIDAPLVAINS